MPQDENITAQPTDGLIRSFSVFLDTDPNPALLLSRDGGILAMNRIGRRSLTPIAVDGNLSAYCSNPERFLAYLSKCSATSGPLPGAVELTVPGEAAEKWRCDGGLVQPAAASRPALLLVRLTPQREALGGFLTLTEKVNALDAALRRQQQIQNELEEALTAKDVLLSEVQHRIKNNLQVVLSMLSLAMRNAPDALSRASLMDASNRVKAMSAVHTLLYDTADFVEIDCGQLVRLLVEAADHAYGREDVTVSVEAEPLFLTADSAISLALIVNEIVSNAYKHAFPPGRPGHINVKLEQANSFGIVAVVDDGTEFVDKAPSTGLSLARALAEKLGGALNIETEPLKRMSVTFRLDRTGGSPAHKS